VPGSKWRAVVDEKESREYQGIGGLFFSHDSKHVAYGAMGKKKQLIIVDGQESREFDAFLLSGELYRDGPDTFRAFLYDDPFFIGLEIAFR
jgi:hypothetical protein